MRLSMPMEEVQLVSVIPGTDLWEDITPWRPTAGILGVRGILVLAEKQNNFRVRVGIQTARSETQVADTPIAPATGTGLGYVTTVSKNFFDFDPTVDRNGLINTMAFFRIGLLYSSTDAVVSRGNVLLYTHYIA